MVPSSLKVPDYSCLSVGSSLHQTGSSKRGTSKLINVHHLMRKANNPSYMQQVPTVYSSAANIKCDLAREIVLH